VTVVGVPVTVGVISGDLVVSVGRFGRLAAVIGEYPGLLTEDDEHWTSTGASEVTHIEALALRAQRTDDRE
jgi:hypothetical protein